MAVDQSALLEVLDGSPRCGAAAREDSTRPAAHDRPRQRPDRDRGGPAASGHRHAPAAAARPRSTRIPRDRPSIVRPDPPVSPRPAHRPAARDSRSDAAKQSRTRAACRQDRRPPARPTPSTTGRPASPPLPPRRTGSATRRSPSAVTGASTASHQQPGRRHGQGDRVARQRSRDVHRFSGGTTCSADCSAAASSGLRSDRRVRVLAAPAARDASYRDLGLGDRSPTATHGKNARQARRPPSQRRSCRRRPQAAAALLTSARQRSRPPDSHPHQRRPPVCTT